MWFKSLIALLVEHEVDSLRTEYRLTMEYEDAALLFSAIDTLRILERHQVFIRTHNPHRNEWDIWTPDRCPNGIAIFNEDHLY